MSKSLLTALFIAIVGFSSPLFAGDAATSPPFELAGKSGVCVILVDTNDYPVVAMAAKLLAEDIEKVSGKRPRVEHEGAYQNVAVIAGTIGHSALIQKLAAAGKLQDLDKLQGKWETTLSQIVEKPFAGIDRAWVVVGSDRRGTAYGLMKLSEKIGVSPWHWWADVPVKHQSNLSVKISTPEIDAPAVKYRGIFINDEDWGLNPWAAKTFDPDFKNIGPKTYEKVFELMLRLRLNYLWPAMHPCSREFGSVPENVALADKFGIVAGSSHCEPMLCNNVHWNEKEKGRWNYFTNRDTIHSYWEENTKARSSEEAVWTLGIRGIHDAGMEKPPEKLSDRIELVSRVITDQRELLHKYVATNFGPVAQCFVPYKEVLPIFDAGLKVPDDVTLVWVDDNFGYIRRLSAPDERKRSGGAGVYWHLSYYGGPHSYTWINTTAPALMWEELHKAWENDARNLWVINVGDIKPMEIGIDYFARLAWNPDGFDGGAQGKFLRAFSAKNFGEKSARPLADFLTELYRLGTIHKPELMNREWALSLTPERAVQLEADCKNLLRREKEIAATISDESRDAYTETIGFPAHVLGMTGLIFMADRNIQFGTDVAANEKEISRLRQELEKQVVNFNTKIAGGKWNRMMPGLETGKFLTAWSSQVRWPWGEKKTETNSFKTSPASSRDQWRDASSARKFSSGAANWQAVEGLGPSGRAMALLPATLQSSWLETDTNSPGLEFDFHAKGGDAEALIDFLPTFRIYPGMKLRVAVSVDDAAPQIVEVPGSSGAENENGKIRQFAVQDNFVRAPIPLKNLSAGKHVFKIRAMDPGAVIDQVSLPSAN